MNILLVDDEKRLVAVLKKGLEIEGFRVDVAYNGTTGLRKALSGVYDCIILDVRLPGKDGLTVCKELRDNGSTTPVIIITAVGSEDMKKCARSSGANKYLAKPFDFDELLSYITSVTSRP